MAVTKTATKYAVKAEYKTTYDTEGEFPALTNYAQTFSNVKESATVEQLKNFVDTLLSLTVYNGAPYQVKLVDTSTLIVG